MSTREACDGFYRKMNETTREFKKYVANKLEELGGELPLYDENMDDEEDNSVRLDVIGSDNDYVFHPTFDRIKAVKDDDEEPKLMFHVKDGDSWEDDGQWVKEWMFSSNAEYIDLFGYIEWPED